MSLSPYKKQKKKKKGKMEGINVVFCSKKWLEVKSQEKKWKIEMFKIEVRMKGIFPQTLKEPYLVPSRLIFYFSLVKWLGPTTSRLQIAIVSTFPYATNSYQFPPTWLGGKIIYPLVLGSYKGIEKIKNKLENTTIR